MLVVSLILNSNSPFIGIELILQRYGHGAKVIHRTLVQVAGSGEARALTYSGGNAFWVVPSILDASHVLLLNQPRPAKNHDESSNDRFRRT